LHFIPFWKLLPRSMTCPRLPGRVKPKLLCGQPTTQLESPPLSRWQQVTLSLILRCTLLFIGLAVLGIELLFWSLLRQVLYHLSPSANPSYVFLFSYFNLKVGGCYFLFCFVL
jgi:hypothetical protein